MIKRVLIIMLLFCGVVYGLGQRVAVIHMRGIAADLELSPTQVAGLTKQQAHNYLVAGYPDLPTDKSKNQLHNQVRCLHYPQYMY